MTMKIQLMARVLFLITIFFLWKSEIKAQTPTLNWVSQTGGPSLPDQSIAFNVAVDSKGNTYTVGFFTGTVDFDPSPTDEFKLSAMNRDSIAPLEFHQAMLIGAAKIDWSLEGDAFICKLDSLGNFVWVKRVGGKQSNRDMSARIKEIQIDANDDLNLVGAFEDSIDFNPSDSESFEVISRYEDDHPTINSFVLKLDENGNFKWVKTYDATYFLFSAIALDSVGDVFLTGVSAVCVVKLDKDTGNEIWYKNIGGGPFGAGSSITFDKDDNILITGKFGGVNIDFNPDPTEEFLITSAGASNPYVSGFEYAGDIFILKLNHEGEFIWVKSIKTDPRTTDYGFDIETDSDGNVLIVGNVSGPVNPTGSGGVSFQYDFDPDPIEVHNVTIESGNGAFILKLDPFGKFIWVNKIAQLINTSLGRVFNGGNSLCVDKCDNIYITGFFGGTCDFDPSSTSTFLMTSSQPLPDPSINISVKGDIYMTKLSSDGNLKWAGQFGTGVGTDIRVDNKNNIYFTGAFGSGFTYLGIHDDLPDAILPDFDPTSSGVHTMRFGKKYAYFTSKLTPTPLYITATDSSICAFDTTLLSAVGNYNNYNWKPTSVLIDSTGKDVSATPFEPTKYTVLAPNGICFDSASIIININPSTTISITAQDSVLCLGESTNLHASGVSSYSWSPSLGLNATTGSTVTASPTVTTTYIVKELNPSGNSCPGVGSRTIQVNIPPIIDVITQDQTIDQGNSVNLEVTGGSVYNWSPADGLSCTTCSNPTATPQFTTNYCVSVTDSTNCPASKCVNIKVKYNCGELFVPNGFSPNGDKLNDVLEVKVNPTCVTEYNFQIYDRWGELVFESTKISDSWDGKHKGKELDNAVFVYYLKVKLIDGTDFIVKKGNVSIVK